MSDQPVLRADARLSALVPSYAAIICDVWGVLHNGVASWPAATQALTKAREAGLKVVLVSNAPRPNHCIYPQLDGLGVPRSAYDAIITSGDLAREWVAARPGVKIWHIGPERDMPLFEGLDMQLVEMKDAEAIVCTGPYHDETETPEMYRDRLKEALALGLPMVCANPDLVVEKGTRLIYCAGALGDLYQELGGITLYMGKPHRAVYQKAVLALSALVGRNLVAKDILAIGDAIRTDLLGAAGMGIDALFLAGGIHAGDAGSRDAVDVQRLADMCGAAKVSPAALAWSLEW